MRVLDRRFCEFIQFGVFDGSFVALVTPFKNGNLDDDGLRANIRFQIEGGSAGLVAIATTGESPTLSEEEKETVVRICVEECKDRVPLIVSTGTNSTAKTIEATGRAKEDGADAALVITPYYNKPTQEGLFQHFKAVTTAVDIPIVLYNVPGRTGVNMQPKTLARLSEFENIVAVKEASGNLDQVSEIIATCSGSLTVLSGDDSLTLPMLALGAKGVISVLANILPGDVSSMIDAFNRGDIEGAKRLHHRLFPLVKALFLETNPIPIKRAMELMGLAAGQPRLPLVRLSGGAEAELKRVLNDMGILD